MSADATLIFDIKQSSKLHLATKGFSLRSILTGTQAAPFLFFLFFVCFYYQILLIGMVIQLRKKEKEEYTTKNMLQG